MGLVGLFGLGATYIALGAPAIGIQGGVAGSTSLSTTEPTFGPTGQTQVAIVTRVVDGDTIRVEIDGREHNVSYIGVRAPALDTDDPRTRELAIAAVAANSLLVGGRDIILERDASQTDEPDQLFRHVWILDRAGRPLLVNADLVRRGLARVSTFSTDVKHIDLLITAQEVATTAKVGLWASAPTAAPTPQPTDRPTPRPTPVAFVDGGPNCHPSYTGCLPIVEDLDCPEVRFMGKAPVQVKGPDEYRLDFNGDGLGCE